MPGKEGGKAKPLKKPKGKEKNYDDEDIEFLKKKKAEENHIHCMYTTKEKTNRTGWMT